MTFFVRFLLILSFVFIPHHVFAQKPELTFYAMKDWYYSGGAMCHISNEFNNGFLMQFDGQDGRLESLSLDVRQDAFILGRSYTAELSVPGSLSNISVEGRAQSSSTLVMNISMRDDVYQAVREEAALDVEIEQNRFRFYLGAFDVVSAQLDECLGRKTQPKVVSDIVVSTKEHDQIADGIVQPQPTQPIEMTHKNIGGNKAGLEYLGISKDSSVKVNREIVTGRADFTSNTQNSVQDVVRLRRENTALRNELNMALQESTQEEMSIKSNNWDLERATMMFNESERQVQMLGQKLQRQDQKCRAEKKELEAMLFDPMVTNEQQLSRLATLENELADAQQELELQRMRYDERIRLLESRLTD